MKSKPDDPSQLSLFSEDDFEEDNSKTHVESQLPEKMSIPMSSLMICHRRSYNLDPLFQRLAHSSFRSRFHLGVRDKAYVKEKGIEVIRQHAADFVAKRLAPAFIPNDGKQTPMRGHPVFLAQHATGCCCRGCFSKWHHIPAGRTLSVEEQDYAVSVLMTWIIRECNR